MISKQLMAFFAGVTMVVACAGAFVLYDQKNGPEIQSDADTTGDGKVSNDPTSGFMSYDGHKYFLHYGSVSMYSSSSQSFNTSYTISFDANEHGFLTGYVNNIQVNLSSSQDSVLYHQGSNNINVTTRYTDSANSGLALLKQMQFVFTPLEEKNDITFTRTTHTTEPTESNPNTYTYYTLDYPADVLSDAKVDLYVNNFFVTTLTLGDSGSCPLNSYSTYSGNFDNLWIVIGNSVYKVVMA